MTTASVTSIDTLKAVKTALVQFCADVEAALVSMELEARRPVDWIEGDRARYWPQQARRASDAVQEGRQALVRCEVRVSSEDRPSCYDEKKALEKAKRRLQVAEDKSRIVHRWGSEMQKATEDFATQVARLRSYLETDVVKAIAAAERMAAALDKYTEQGKT
ncbi:MAG TPA: hypothetical protein VGI40_08390 [Pirellulaceae bacterium]|jgi:hypothetical protein